MTIQDALERAKLLRTSREGSAHARPERPRAPEQDVATLPAHREAVPAEPAGPAVHYSDLERVSFDAEACERFNVLVTGEQLANSAQAAAAYRLMRGRILLKVKAAGGWSCVGISSPGPGEGKTVTTLNLAISIAREKQRMVYLLDLDMRNPSMCQRAGFQPPRALAQYFTEGLSPESVLYQTDVDHLVVAGNLQAVPNASELLASPRLDELIKYIRRRSPGAIIFIDLPPVLSTDEALVVAPRTDAMFLVVAEGITRRDGLAKASDVLSDFTVAGIIMNRSSEGMGADYYAY